MNMSKTTYINKEKYQLVILKVTSSDEHGRPKTAEIGYDDTVFNIEEGMEFITAWVPTRTIEKTND